MLGLCLAVATPKQLCLANTNGVDTAAQCYRDVWDRRLTPETFSSGRNRQHQPDSHKRQRDEGNNSDEHQVKTAGNNINSDNSSDSNKPAASNRSNHGQSYNNTNNQQTQQQSSTTARTTKNNQNKKNSNDIDKTFKTKTTEKHPKKQSQPRSCACTPHEIYGPRACLPVSPPLAGYSYNYRDPLSATRIHPSE